ncbi:MAG TPA: hypothetical protein VFP91_11395 [Vicinamibacterales bacterium]|nr:hypothetical protein [Vicinamibacterales bacterium]
MRHFLQWNAEAVSLLLVVIFALGLLFLAVAPIDPRPVDSNGPPGSSKPADP